VLPAVEIIALFLRGARRMPRRVGPVARDAERAGFLAPAGVTARRSVAALAPAVGTGDRELSESDGITGVGVVGSKALQDRDRREEDDQAGSRAREGAST
jgi:hypothetical protein